MARQDLAIKTTVVVILSLVTILTTMPFVWMILTGFKTETEALRIPMQFFPDRFMLDNFEAIFNRFHFLTFYRNTIVVAIGVTIPQVIISSMAGYGFARIDFPGKNLVFISLMAALMIPLQMILVPRFALMIAFGWIDTLTGVIVPIVPSVFATFFIRQSIMSLPRELDESAYLDGANHLTIYIFIIMPLIKSTLAAMTVLVMVFSWNNLLWPLIVLMSRDNFTLPVGLAGLSGQFGTPLNLLMAGATVSTIPMILVFFVGQRYFLEGIATTGSKT